MAQEHQLSPRWRRIPRPDDPQFRARADDLHEQACLPILGRVHQSLGAEDFWGQASEHATQRIRREPTRRPMSRSCIFVSRGAEAEGLGRRRFRSC